VRARSNNTVWFNNCFPKTGGGEDVDFCLTLRRVSKAPLVSVPSARVTHPYWRRPLAQVRGWASGDVLCLVTQPQSTFFAPPNWVFVSACSLLLNRPDLALLTASTEMVLNSMAYLPNCQVSAPVLTPVLAAVPPMLQDVTRFVSKVGRMRFDQLLLQFDWMDGNGHHVPVSQLALLLKNIAFTASAVAISSKAAIPVRLFSALAVVGVAWALQRGLEVEAHSLPRSPGCLLDLDPTVGAIPFVVLGSQRSGSNLLCGYLHHHQMIAMHNELFNEKGIYTHHASSQTESFTDVEKRDGNPNSFLRLALGVRTDGAVGFKAFPEHIRRNQDLFDKVLSDHRVRKVVIRRENRLAAAVSMLRASVTGAYVHANLDAVKVAISPSDHQQFIETYDAYYDFLRGRLLTQNVVDLTYEELVASPISSLDRVLNLLNLEPYSDVSAIKSLFNRQSKEPLKHAVANFDELRCAFVGTEREVDFD